MIVAFRADASLAIGSGHVMRCLILADGLAARGHECHFVCRETEGHLGAVILGRGHGLALLRGTAEPYGPGEEAPPHGHWLTSCWREDARAAAGQFADLQAELVIIDHYALDHRWANALGKSVAPCVVIDDLADRVLECDLLLDQNLGRQGADYAGLVPDHCRILLGPSFAPISPIFEAIRGESLERRAGAPLGHIMVSMGGVDADNATGRALQAIAGAPPASLAEVSVIMGPHGPHLESVRAMAKSFPFPVEVAVGVSDMAQRMAAADIGIGGAGITAWERCAVGLPSIAVILAENQRMGACALGDAGAALVIDGVEAIDQELPRSLARMNGAQERRRISSAAADLVDGRGLGRIVMALEELRG